MMPKTSLFYGEHKSLGLGLLCMIKPCKSCASIFTFMMESELVNVEGEIQGFGAELNYILAKLEGNFRYVLYLHCW
jgi:hypothetical protein